MLQLSEFDLQFAFGAAGTLSEDIENQFGAIEHSHFPQSLEVALLDGRDFMIEKHQLSAVGSKQGCNLVGLASTDVKLRIGTRTMADQSGRHGMAGRLGQRAQLIERGIIAARSTQCNADEQCPGNGGV